MHTTNLRKVGGSIMLAVPPAVLELLHLRVGATVDVGVDGDRLIIAPQRRPKFSLDELLAECVQGERTKEDRIWTSGLSRGRELL